MLIILLAIICVLTVFAGYYLPALTFAVFCISVLYFRHRQIKSEPQQIKIIDCKIQSEPENQNHNKIISRSAPPVNDYLSSH